MSGIYASHDPAPQVLLNYALRILYLPIGLFGVAIGTIGCGASRPADAQGVREMRQAPHVTAFLTFPPAGLPLGTPIVRLYQRGRFSALDTQGTATALGPRARPGWATRA